MIEFNTLLKPDFLTMALCVLCVGWLQWLPFIAEAGYGLGKKFGLWGSKPEAPDIGAERFQYDNKWIEDWTQGATADVTRQSEQFLEKAMQGIHGAEHARGLTGTGWAGGKGTEAAEFGAENLATALANIKAKAAGMEHQGMMQGQQMYADEYQRYLNRMYQDQEDWIASMFSLIPSGGGGGGYEPHPGGGII